MFMTLVSKTGCINHVLVAVYIVITKSNKLYSLWLRIFILNYKQTSNQQKGSVISTSRESLIYINELNIFNKLKILGSVHICFVTITYITVTFAFPIQTLSTKGLFFICRKVLSALPVTFGANCLRVLEQTQHVRLPLQSLLIYKHMELGTEVNTYHHQG